ncbi:hypothetical protein ANN_04273 [Periplaneta americana]|uniref:Uncharacterized protein n=1 Tax=Periplaneta americana TaxID=6978 RepID=A0ABQ8T9N8_PERAM|nr:hypothetical protein ANN_04273 [Periplaneta americana]
MNAWPLLWLNSTYGGRGHFSSSPSDNKDAPPPAWLESLRKCLNDSSRPRNIRLFLLKLLLNVESRVRPYALSLLNSVLKAIDDGVLGMSPNYLLSDTVAMVVEWCSKVTSLSERCDRHLVSQLLHLLISNVQHQRRDVFKHNLELIRTVIELFKPNFDLPMQLLYDMIMRMSADRWPNKIFNWTPPEKKRRGRPMKKWSKEVQEDRVCRGLQMGDWQNRTAILTTLNAGRHRRVSERHTIQRWVDQFRVAATAMNKKPMGRPWTVWSPENIERDHHGNTVNSQRYTNLLTTFLIPELQRHGVDLALVYLQQYGAIAHTTRDLMTILCSVFNGRIIFHFEDFLWPARFPDLTACDFFLWGYLKSKCFKQVSPTMTLLRDASGKRSKQFHLQC